MIENFSQCVDAYFDGAGNADIDLTLCELERIILEDYYKNNT